MIELIRLWLRLRRLRQNLKMQEAIMKERLTRLESDEQWYNDTLRRVDPDFYDTLYPEEAFARKEQQKAAAASIGLTNMYGGGGGSGHVVSARQGMTQQELAAWQQQNNLAMQHNPYGGLLGRMQAQDAQQAPEFWPPHSFPMGQQQAREWWPGGMHNAFARRPKS